MMGYIYIMTNPALKDIECKLDLNMGNRECIYG